MQSSKKSGESVAPLAATTKSNLGHTVTAPKASLVGSHDNEAAATHAPNMARHCAPEVEEVIPEVVTPEVVTISPKRGGGTGTKAVTVEPVTVEAETLEGEPITEISADEADAARIRSGLEHSFAQHFGAPAALARSVVPTIAEHEVEVLPAKSGATSSELKPQEGEGISGLDSQQLLKDLEVLKQVKDFNACTSHDSELDEADLGADLSADAIEDDGESDLTSMHLVQGESSSYEDDESGLADYDDSGSDVGTMPTTVAAVGSSRALVRVRRGNTIGAFIQAANREPLLTPEQEHDLAQRFRDLGDLEAARKLVMSHLRLVISVARGYAGYGLPLPDLIQEGNIGLMKAVRHFNPDVGVRLAAFAVQWIKAEILDYVIRNWRMVKVATTKAQRKLFFTLRELKLRLGWFTSDERQEVAHVLGVTTNDVAEMETRLTGMDMSFDADANDDSGASAALPAPSSYLEDENSNFAQVLENSDYTDWQITKLKEAIASLDERSRLIITRRWLDENNKATLQELSTELGVSIERVRQIETNARNKIKSFLLQEGVMPDSDEPLALANNATAGKKKLRAPKSASTKSASTKASSSRALSVVQRAKTKSATTKAGAVKSVKTTAASARRKSEVHSSHVVVTPQDDVTEVPNISLKQAATSASAVTKAKTTKVNKATKLSRGKKDDESK